MVGYKYSLYKIYCNPNYRSWLENSLKRCIKPTCQVIWVKFLRSIRNISKFKTDSGGRPHIHTLGGRGEGVEVTLSPVPPTKNINVGQLFHRLCMMYWLVLILLLMSIQQTLIVRTHFCLWWKLVLTEILNRILGWINILREIPNSLKISTSFFNTVLVVSFKRLFLI